MNKYISNVPEAIFKWVPTLSVYGVSAVSMMCRQDTYLNEHWFESFKHSPFSWHVFQLFRIQSFPGKKDKIERGVSASKMGALGVRN